MTDTFAGCVAVGGSFYYVDLDVGVRGGFDAAAGCAAYGELLGSPTLSPPTAGWTPSMVADADGGSWQVTEGFLVNTADESEKLARITEV